MRINDRLELDSKPRVTRDGYLVATARVARAGIQLYQPWELGKKGTKPLKMYRPEEEVFSKDTMPTFAHRPMTNGHPEEDVNAENWRKYVVGYTGGDVAREDDFIRVPLILMDAVAIKDYRAGKRQLSAGYDVDIEWTPGVTDAGEEYDAVMRNIRNNHIALVDAARAGPGARIGDAGTPPNASTKRGGRMPETRKVVVDGLTIETTEQGAQALEKVQKQLADALSGHQSAVAAKDKELAAKDAEIDALKKQVMDASALDQAITERADLMGLARKLADIDYRGKTPTDIRRMAVAAKLGDAAVKDKSDEYISARFDILVEDTKEPPFRGHPVGDSDPRAAYIQRIQNGGKAAKGA